MMQLMNVFDSKSGTAEERGRERESERETERARERDREILVVT